MWPDRIVVASLDQNSVVGTNKAIDEVSRDRVLTTEELRLVWQLAGDGEYRAIVRLLILTGQRREEVGGMLWPEIEIADVNWRIGAERTKNGLVHDVPLSAPAVEILKARSRCDEKREFVFGAGTGPFQGWSNAKQALDRRMGAFLKAKQSANVELKPWRLHDIRRTVATGLPHIVEAVLNHVSGHRAGVAGVYNRAAYAAEKRTALDAWATRVIELGGRS